MFSSSDKKHKEIASFIDKKYLPDKKIAPFFPIPETFTEVDTKIKWEEDQDTETVSNKDIIREMTETPDTSVNCPESLNDKQLKQVRHNPHLYIEINIITKSRVVDDFFIPADLKVFHYKTLKYNIDQDMIYLLPTKQKFFTPTCFYIEGDPQPKSFKKTNKGITGKALSLLYDDNLYTDLFSEDQNRYNLFIALFLLISVILLVVGIYLTFFYIPEPTTTPPASGGSGFFSIIRSWLPL